MLPPKPAEIPGLYRQALALQKAGDADAALVIYDRILGVAPSQAEVLFQTGRILAVKGDLAKAERSLRAALKTKPKEAAIWQALHGVLTGGAQKKLEREALRSKIPLGSPAEAKPILDRIGKGEAERAIKDAMALARAAPMAAAPVHAVGAAQAALGKWAQAVPAFEEAVKRAPRTASFIADLGRALARVGRPEAALRRLDEAEALVADVALVRARVLRECCRDGEAAEVLEHAAKTSPSFKTLTDLAMSRAALRDVAGARDAFERAFRAKSAPSKDIARIAARRSLASALADAGEVASAIDLLSDALDTQSDHAGLLTQRGQLFQTAGDLAAAEADLIQAIDIAPQEPEAYRAYANGRKTKDDDPIAASLLANIGQPDLSPRARRVMGFAAAKFAADRGDVDAEIEHLARANRLMADAFPYSFDADLATARDLAGDWAALEPMTADGPDDPVLFVTGLPRSGTTLVESILAAHPDVTAGGEMPFLSRALAPAIESLRDGSPDPARFVAAGERYLEAARRKTDAPKVIADKAISTFSRIGHSAAALPGARFIVLRRDLRDTGLSLWRNMFTDGMHRYAYDQIQMARYMRLHEALVSFWAERLPDRVFVVDYEALTAEPEPVIRDLIDFAGLPWDDAWLAPQSAKRSVATLSFAQVRQPIGRASVAGWRRFETLLAELDRTELPDLRA